MVELLSIAVSRGVNTIEMTLNDINAFLISLLLGTQPAHDVRTTLLQRYFNV